MSVCLSVNDGSEWLWTAESQRKDRNMSDMQRFQAGLKTTNQYYIQIILKTVAEQLNMNML